MNIKYACILNTYCPTGHILTLSVASWTVIKYQEGTGATYFKQPERANAPLGSPREGESRGPSPAGRQPRPPRRRRWLARRRAPAPRPPHSREALGPPRGGRCPRGLPPGGRAAVAPSRAAPRCSSASANGAARRLSGRPAPPSPSSAPFPGKSCRSPASPKFATRECVCEGTEEARKRSSAR